jgi:FtsH-binding integral membrane protein
MKQTRSSSARQRRVAQLRLVRRHPMHSVFVIRLALIGIVGIGTLLVFISTFLTRPWVCAEWVKVDFWIIGVVGIAWTVLKFALLLSYQSMTRHTYLFLDHIGTLLSGIVLGLLALFFLSGEAVRGCKRWRELKRQRTNVI